MMKKTLILVVTVLLFSKFCEADLAKKAEEVLSELRLVSSLRLNNAFLEHAKLGEWIDSTALNIKNPMADPDDEKAEDPTPASEEVVSCVNKLVEEAIDLMCESSTKSSVAVLKQIYEEEKALVLCGRADEECLQEVVDDIRTQIKEIPENIEKGLKSNKEALMEKIEAMKACSGEDED